MSFDERQALHDEYQYRLGALAALQSASFNIDDALNTAHVGERKGLKHAQTVIDKLVATARQKVDTQFALLSQPDSATT